MSFTAQDVKALRESTGAGMMDAKRALTDAEALRHTTDNETKIRDAAIQAANYAVQAATDYGVAGIYVAGVLQILVACYFVHEAREYAAKADKAYDTFNSAN